MSYLQKCDIEILDCHLKNGKNCMYYHIYMRDINNGIRIGANLFNDRPSFITVKQLYENNKIKNFHYNVNIERDIKTKTSEFNKIHSINILDDGKTEKKDSVIDKNIERAKYQQGELAF